MHQAAAAVKNDGNLPGRAELLHHNFFFFFFATAEPLLCSVSAGVRGS